LVLGGGGRGYHSSGGKAEEIGDSHFGGILQTGAGIYYNIVKGWMGIEGRISFPTHV